MKVLPHYLDLEGRRALSPSLYERDAYQDYLRKHPEERSALRFDVQWKAQGKEYSQLKIRLEIRGGKTSQGSDVVLERTVRPKALFSSWSSLTLERENFERVGEVLAWRVSLWNGDRLLGEQASFLW